LRSLRLSRYHHLPLHWRGANLHRADDGHVSDPRLWRAGRSGGATGAAGGGGAEIGGDFSLTAGETLGIFVGGAGGSAIKGGGGGGSFVIQPVSAKLVIAGGGGGYNGSGGGGGGSFDAGVDQVLKAGVQAGDGEVMITELASGPPLPVPEPSSLAMIATGLAGLAGLGAMRRRSKT
jgi:hypothetical protein